MSRGCDGFDSPFGIVQLYPVQGLMKKKPQRRHLILIADEDRVRPVRAEG